MSLLNDILEPVKSELNRLRKLCSFVQLSQAFRIRLNDGSIMHYILELDALVVQFSIDLHQNQHLAPLFISGKVLATTLGVQKLEEANPISCRFFECFPGAGNSFQVAENLVHLQTAFYPQIVIKSTQTCPQRVILLVHRRIHKTLEKSGSNLEPYCCFSDELIAKVVFGDTMAT